jgi:ribosomal RNA methyltransferase Nop2
MRIRETLKVLSNLKQLKNEHRSRSDYMEELKNDLCSAYDYNRDVVDLIMDLFAPSEAFEFIEANEN